MSIWQNNGRSFFWENSKSCYKSYSPRIYKLLNLICTISLDACLLIYAKDKGIIQTLLVDVFHKLQYNWEKELQRCQSIFSVRKQYNSCSCWRAQRKCPEVLGHYEAGNEMTFSWSISIFAAVVLCQFHEVHEQIVKEWVDCLGKQRLWSEVF